MRQHRQKQLRWLGRNSEKKKLVRTQMISISQKTLISTRKS